MPATDHRPYVLGPDPHELERLDRQAASPTRWAAPR